MYSHAMLTDTTPSLSDLLARFRDIKDAKDEVNARLKDLNKREGEMESAILAAMESAGFVKSGDKVSSAAGTATRQTKWRAKYDPEKWPDIVKWCAENNRTDLVQRRLSDTRIMEIVDLGQPLPDGIEPESYTDLSFRRS